MVHGVYMVVLYHTGCRLYTRVNKCNGKTNSIGVTLG